MAIGGATAAWPVRRKPRADDADANGAGDQHTAQASSRRNSVRCDARAHASTDHVAECGGRGGLGRRWAARDRFGQGSVGLRHSPLVGRLAPDFTLAQLDGPSLTLSKLRGQVVVVNFWASWCTECHTEQSALDQTWQRFRDSGVVVVGVNFEDTTGDARDYVHQPVWRTRSSRTRTRVRRWPTVCVAFPRRSSWTSPVASSTASSVQSIAPSLPARSTRSCWRAHDDRAGEDGTSAGGAARVPRDTGPGRGRGDAGHRGHAQVHADQPGATGTADCGRAALSDLQGPVGGRLAGAASPANAPARSRKRSTRGSRPTKSAQASWRPTATRCS